MGLSSSIQPLDAAESGPRARGELDEPCPQLGRSWPASASQTGGSGACCCRVRSVTRWSCQEPRAPSAAWRLGSRSCSTATLLRSPADSENVTLIWVVPSSQSKRRERPAWDVRPRSGVLSNLPHASSGHGGRIGVEGARSALLPHASYGHGGRIGVEGPQSAPFSPIPFAHGGWCYAGASSRSRVLPRLEAVGAGVEVALLGEAERAPRGGPIGGRRPGNAGHREQVRPDRGHSMMPL